MKTALTIAGSDPTGGAGAQLDLGVFRKIGVYGLSAITAVTAQNTKGVRDIFPLPLHIVRGQISTVLEDIRIDAIKTGMLYSKDVAGVVSEIEREDNRIPLVVDPVTISSSGCPLTINGNVEELLSPLLPLTTVITPNVYEASLLSGVRIEGIEDMERAARALKSRGPGVVIITGGRLSEPDPGGLQKSPSGITLDLYYDGIGFHRLESELYPGEYHGTGCAFSSAITAYLALGKNSLEAARLAKNLVTDAIRRAYHPGHGMGLLRV